MRPCSRCGVGERYKTSSWCYPCIRAYQAQRYEEQKEPLTARECKFCACSFQPSHGNQIRCKACKHKQPSRAKPGSQRRTDGLCPRCGIRRTGRRNGSGDGYCKECRAEYSRERGHSRRVFTAGMCAVCGENFVSANSNSVIGKYCSTRCQRKVWRAAQRANGKLAEQRKRYKTKYPEKNRYKAFRGETRKFIPVILADPCAYCGHPSAEVEHIVPRARGGVDTWDNLTGACASCNRSKSDSSLLDYLLSV